MLFRPRLTRKRVPTSDARASLGPSVLLLSPGRRPGMTRLQSLCLFLLAPLVAACASPKVGYDYDSSANFTVYHTYAWVADKQEVTGDQRLDNSLVDGRI